MTEQDHLELQLVLANTLGVLIGENDFIILYRTVVDDHKGLGIATNLDTNDKVQAIMDHATRVIASQGVHAEPETATSVN